MAKQIILGILAVVLGTVVGMVVMMSLHLASTLIYPLPEGVDFMSQEPDNLARLHEWFGTLPAGAFFVATLCHGLGCMSGAVVAMLISGRRLMMPALIVGVVFTIGGIMNLTSIPHPSWFPIIDLPIYLLLALLAAKMLKREEVNSTAATAG